MLAVLTAQIISPHVSLLTEQLRKSAHNYLFKLLVYLRRNLNFISYIA
jgi:hypothetical protein